MLDPQLFKGPADTLLTAGYHEDTADPGYAHHGIFYDALHFLFPVKAGLHTGNLKCRYTLLEHLHKAVHTGIVDNAAEIAGNDQDLPRASRQHFQQSCCRIAALFIVHADKAATPGSHDIGVKRHHRDLPVHAQYIELSPYLFRIHRHDRQSLDALFFQHFDGTQLILFFYGIILAHKHLKAQLFQLLFCRHDTCMYRLHKVCAGKLGDDTDLPFLYLRTLFPFFFHIAKLAGCLPDLLCHCRIDPATVI